jgi:DNA oxidative demethylase
MAGFDPRGHANRTPEATAAAVAPTGLRILAGFFDRREQERLVALLRDIFAQAPLYIPTMPGSGRPCSVRMTNCGPLGWVSDKSGYRYQAMHPVTGEPWPLIPEALLRTWSALSDYPHPPQACLVNYYSPTARMGLHQDRDEEDFSAPVISVSLGATCRFRIGTSVRAAPTTSFLLGSGDVLVMGGPSRLAFHGVDRILPGTSTLVADGGRINLTLRRVTRLTAAPQ